MFSFVASNASPTAPVTDAAFAIDFSKSVNVEIAFFVATTIMPMPAALPRSAKFLSMLPTERLMLEAIRSNFELIPVSLLVALSFRLTTRFIVATSVMS